MMTLRELSTGNVFQEHRGVWEVGQKYKNRKHLFEIVDEGDPVMIQKQIESGKWKDLHLEDRDTATNRTRGVDGYRFLESKNLSIFDSITRISGSITTNQMIVCKKAVRIILYIVSALIAGYIGYLFV